MFGLYEKKHDVSFKRFLSNLLLRTNLNLLASFVLKQYIFHDLDEIPQTYNRKLRFVVCGKPYNFYLKVFPVELKFFALLKRFSEIIFGEYYETIK